MRRRRRSISPGKSRGPKDRRPRELPERLEEVALCAAPSRVSSPGSLPTHANLEPPQRTKNIPQFPAGAGRESLKLTEYGLKQKSGPLGRSSWNKAREPNYLLVSAFLSEEVFAAFVFLADGFFAVFLVLAFEVAAGLSVALVDPLEPVCATARLAPNITVTTNISS